MQVLQFMSANLSILQQCFESIKQLSFQIYWISSLLLFIIQFLWRLHTSKKAPIEEPSYVSPPPDSPSRFRSSKKVLMVEPLVRNPVSEAGESSGTTLQEKLEMELRDSSCSVSPLPDSSCEICTEPKYSFELFAIKGCSHVYCTACLSQYISSKVEMNQLLIKCPRPDCRTGKLEPEACSPILEDSVFDLWCAALCESVVKNKLYCPFKDCSALMINDAASVIKQAVCPHCNRLFCAKCMVPWHTGLCCSEFQAESSSTQIREDLMLIKLAKKRLWKRCPNCKFFVEKTSGCMFIKCRCGFTFCYRCASKKKASRHYCSVCKC